VVLDRMLSIEAVSMSEAERARYQGIRFHLLMELQRVSEASGISPAHPRLMPSAETVEDGPYVCASCGYMGRHHAWQCPGCFSWDSMRAISRS
jgi:lipopolysaccharide biosynthesis regulator YciM